MTGPVIPSRLQLRTLLKRHAELKRRLVDATLGHPLQPVQSAMTRLGLSKDDDTHWTEATELVLRGEHARTPDAPPWVMGVLSDLGAADARLVQSMLDNHRAVLLIGPRQANLLSAFDLVSLRPMMVTANGDDVAPIINQFPAGHFVRTFLNRLPDTDVWIFSGIQQLFVPAARAQMIDIALKIAATDPRTHLQNPQLLHEALTWQRRAHEIFVDLHGGSLMVDAPERIEALMEQVHARHDELFGEGLDTAARLGGHLRGMTERAREVEMDELGMYSHPRAGFCFHPRVIPMTEALEAGQRATRQQIEQVQAALSDPGIPWELFEAMAATDAQATAGLIGEAVGWSSFTWERANVEQLQRRVRGAVAPEATPPISLLTPERIEDALGRWTPTDAAPARPRGRERKKSRR